MKQMASRIGACLLTLSTTIACDDGGGTTAGGSAGSAGSSSGSAGGSGGSAGGSGGSASGKGGSGGSATSGGSGGTAGAAGDPPCTMTWSGSATGTADCTDGASSKFLGVATATTVGWLVAGETADHTVSFSFSLAKPPAAMTYEGTAEDDQFCTVIVSSTDFLSNWTADSKSPAEGASCSITLTSVVDDSSGASSTFIVHGTATATAVLAADASSVTVDVTF